MFVLGLAVVAPALRDEARAQTAPTCPAGSTFNAATGQCEQPATLECPAGTTLTGSTCEATLTCPDAAIKGAPAAREVVGNPTGSTSATCSAYGMSATETTLICPAGTAVSGFTTGVSTMPGTPGTITCSGPQSFVCPAGFTLSGTTCTAPATCPPGATLAGGVCETPAPPPTPAPTPVFSGFALAIGGGAGSTGPDEPEPDDELWCPGDQVPLRDAAGNLVFDEHGFLECVEVEDSGNAPPSGDLFASDGFA